MSLALVAVLLIRLDAHLGEWVTVADLAKHVNVSEQIVREHLEAMHRDGRHALALSYEQRRLHAALVCPEICWRRTSIHAACT